ncbi:dsDNA nuclease domain-containing protein [Pseudomonas sp. R3.Fl]|uniref:HamA C-terminal domain-containing protein n=1 Tax=Pseudomonas sp. R3.Fl TaxID=2928708 RepID=UPI00201E3B94|nr:dsDNA nuclease domain-containing protein [Pseudomonas sp. R3.Fl]MCL6691352.1 dsDNA nuclease domain-containing protein [Pseudomonas sp. R3.Fl]
MESNDSGGVAAKHGFLFQDCVAAYHVTRMLRDKTIRSVRCEVTDDIDIISDRHIDFVQVKSTEKARWNISDIVKNSKGADKKTIPCSSILHKSMQCESGAGLSRRYLIVTEDKVNKTLEYLTISLTARAGKPGRQELIDDLNKRTTNYQTALGVSVADWVEAATWEVYHSLRELELMGIRNIRMASEDLHGVILSSESVAEDIWCRILDTVTRKGEYSRRIHSADDKTYTRPDLLEWFKLRVEDDQSRSGRKIYVKRDLPHILSPFRAPMVSACAKRNGQVLHQQYSLRQYRYKHIVDNVCQWLDEVFLRPKEMSDIHKLTLVEKQERLRTSVFKSLHDVREFLGRVLLHATIRQHHESQPIPCMLYVERSGSEKILENVHIIRRDPEGDQLWIGFSELVTDVDIAVRLPQIRDQLYEDIAECIDTARKKILDVKDDDYLLRHDIDEILDGSQPFDAHLDRFTFVLFVGYDSHLLTDPETPGYEDDLEKETAVLFEKFAADLIEGSPFAALCVHVFIYPAPSLEQLTKLVETKVKEVI